MPRTSDKPKEEKKTAYMVIVDGEDRTLMATDEKDLQKQIEKLRKEAVST